MKISQARFKQAEYVRNTWHIRPEEGVTLDQVLDPAYWAHVAVSLKKGDLIHVLPDNDAYFAELLVMSSQKLTAKVALLRAISLNGDVQVPAEDSGFELKFRGPSARWSIIRKSDREVIKEQMSTKEEAASELEAYLKAFAA